MSLLSSHTEKPPLQQHLALAPGESFEMLQDWEQRIWIFIEDYVMEKDYTMTQPA